MLPLFVNLHALLSKLINTWLILCLSPVTYGGTDLSIFKIKDKFFFRAFPPGGNDYRNNNHKNYQGKANKQELSQGLLSNVEAENLNAINCGLFGASGEGAAY